MSTKTIQLELFDGRSWHSLAVPSERVMVGKLCHAASPVTDVKTLLLDRLAEPLGTPPLCERIKAGSRVLVVADDYTRPTPVHLLLEPLLDELNRLGVPDANITVLVAAGFHREMTDHEKKLKYGQHACERVRIVHHFAENRSELVYLGEASGGCPVWVNRRLKECDFSIGIGTIEVHPWAGYAGGGKIISPGVAGKKTIDATHSMPHRSEVELGRTIGNPFWEMGDEVARRAGLGMVINTVLDEKGRIIELAVGDHRQAQLWGIERFRQTCEVLLPRRAEIVITSARPKFQYWGQSVISLYAADRVVADGGVRITVADCPEGLGDCEQEKGFYHDSLATAHQSLEQYWRDWLGQENCHSRNTCAVYRHLQMLQRSRTIMVSNNLSGDLVNQEVAVDLGKVLKRELVRYGPSAAVAVYPDGAMYLPTVDAERYKKATVETVREASPTPDRMENPRRR